MKRFGHHPLEGGVILFLVKQRLPTDAAVENVKDHSARKVARVPRHVRRIGVDAATVNQLGELIPDPFSPS